MPEDTQTPAPADSSPTMAQTGFANDRANLTLGESMRSYVERVRGGDMGALPAIGGLVVLFVVFSSLRPETFTGALNIANLLVQASSISILAMGLVPVLLLGDIDLSAGVAGGLAAGFTAVAIVRHGQGWFLAVLIGMAVGALIGLVIGLLVAKLGIPSFVVTLAFFLGLQGFTLKLIGQGGTVPVRNDVLRGITIKSMPVLAGWIVVIVLLALYAGLLILATATADRQGPAPSADLARGAQGRRARGDPARHDGLPEPESQPPTRTSSPSRASRTPCSWSAPC